MVSVSAVCAGSVASAAGSRGTLVRAQLCGTVLCHVAPSQSISDRSSQAIPVGFQASRPRGSIWGHMALRWRGASGVVLLSGKSLRANRRGRLLDAQCPNGLVSNIGIFNVLHGLVYEKQPCTWVPFYHIVFTARFTARFRARLPPISPAKVLSWGPGGPLPISVFLNSTSRSRHECTPVKL